MNMATHFDDLVTCTVCFEYHDHPKRLPPCDHVFCATCLGRIVTGGVITCPTCQAPSQVPTGGVNDFKTDQTVKKLVESFRCTDCKNIEQQAKECIHCNAIVCSTCAVIHDSREKCGLIGSLRSLSIKVPTSDEVQRIEQLEVEWTIFREENARQKQHTAACIARTISSLVEKNTAITDKYDEFDKFAEERLKWLKEAKEMESCVRDLQKYINETKVATVKQARKNAESHDEFFSEKKLILSEHVPDNLGTINLAAELLDGEIATLGNQIIRRKAGRNDHFEVVWCFRKGEVWKDVTMDMTENYSEEKLAEGRIELLRLRGGYYTLRVVNGSGAIKWSKTWNNADGTKASMYSGTWPRVLWLLQEGDEKITYVTVLRDHDSVLSFREAMIHAMNENFTLA